jgi:hypothetical protein
MVTGDSSIIILATWEVEIGRIVVPDQLRQKKKKITRPHINQWLGTMLHACLPTQRCMEAQIEKSQSRPARAQRETLSQK